MTVKNMTSQQIQLEAEYRYHMDAQFHARVEIAVRIAQEIAPKVLAEHRQAIEYGAMIGVYLADQSQGGLHQCGPIG
jgi:hypothetical protein